MTRDELQALKSVEKWITEPRHTSPPYLDVTVLCGLIRRTAVSCPKCGGLMIEDGKALRQTFTGTPDFYGDHVITMSPVWRGDITQCNKCSECGWSIS